MRKYKIGDDVWIVDENTAYAARIADRGKEMYIVESKMETSEFSVVEEDDIRATKIKAEQAAWENAIHDTFAHAIRKDVAISDQLRIIETDEYIEVYLKEIVGIAPQKVTPIDPNTIKDEE